MKRFFAILAAACAACAGVTAAPAQDGITPTSILIGQSAAFTGPAAQLGIQMRDGAKLWFDHINTQGGNDTIYGRGGDDDIQGGPGNDVIYAGSGNDTILAGTGADLVWGGSGNDTFVFAAAADSTPSSFDSIQDFQVGVDRIDVEGLDFVAGTSGLGNLAAHSLNWSQVGSDTIILGDTNGNAGTAEFKIVLKGITATSLHLSDGLQNLSCQIARGFICRKVSV